MRFSDKPIVRLLCLIYALVLCAQMAGCTAITKYQCNNKDWQSVGNTDGVAGKSLVAAFEEHNATCAAAGSNADMSLYKLGYDNGILAFCTYSNGVLQAKKGFIDNNVCPAEVAKDFSAGFKAGVTQLCTTEGGFELGSNGNIYHGTCPDESEKPFLGAYLQSMERRLTDARLDKIEADANLNSINSSIARISANISSYNSAIYKAKKDGNTGYAEDLEAGVAPLNQEKSRLQSQKKKYTADSKKADEQFTIASEMLDKWQAKLL